MKNVRVRFAPSPTGFFHIGSARTALFNWLYAKHTNGTFILRIEDTDTQRNTQEALNVLIDGMKWLGLDWDEGPEAGGEFGPYFQSQRSNIYQEYLSKLKSTGLTYEKEGAIFFKVSEKPQVIQDAVRGEVTRLEDKDFVIFRSDGTPVFHFVNVVDDICMKITHVIRGEDHLSNTSKHLELFKAFGAEIPVFAHIPLILKSEGNGKMSKRDQGALIEEYKQNLFLPEAVRNYLCLLGWSPKFDREILPIDEIISLFDLPQINKNNARFDEKKMTFVNSAYVRNLPKPNFFAKGKQILETSNFDLSSFSDDYVEKVLFAIQEKINSFKEIPALAEHFFSDDFSFDSKSQAKIFKSEEAFDRLREILFALESTDDFSELNLSSIVKRLATEHNVSTGQYIHTTRFAVSGKEVGPSFYAILEILGKKSVLNRIKKYLKLFSKKI